MIYSLLLFITFIRRDMHVYAERIKHYFINYGVIYPIIYTFCFGYILPHIGGQGHTTLPVNVISAGLILFTLFPLAFQINLDLLLDFENDRFIDYQIILLSPRLVLLEKILFSSVLVFICNISFYPFVMFMMRNYFDFSAVAWGKTMFMIYIACLFCASFSLFLVCMMRDMTHIRFVWRRCNYPLIMLGGFLTPWNIMAAYSPALGYLVLANPMLYITEGLRHTIIGSDMFLSFSTCALALCAFSLASTLGALWFFKKKMDHI
jgi:ABC-type polysaccharide/polyol phosphate export permease